MIFYKASSQAVGKMFLGVLVIIAIVINLIAVYEMDLGALPV